MNIFVPHSTSNRGLNDTSQVPRELEDSQIFLEIRDASRIRKNINRLQQQKGDRRINHLQLQSEVLHG